MIPFKAKYVSILGKSVNAKVFDNVMSYEFIKKDNVKLANPLAINLKKYHCDLSNMLEVLEKRINFISWKHLPEEEQEK